LTAAADPGSRRLDQWLWFARFAKSRSLAARLCAAGAVAVNGTVVSKPSHAVRVGDAVALPQGRLRRTVRVRDLGARRGPPREARLLYDEAAAPVPLSATVPAWTPLLEDGPAASFETAAEPVLGPRAARTRGRPPQDDLHS
jgi:ribosome-associated heat shock protein Hsp15